MAKASKAIALIRLGGAKRRGVAVAINSAPTAAANVRNSRRPVVMVADNLPLPIDLITSYAGIAEVIGVP